jgi:hypothetical protein
VTTRDIFQGFEKRLSGYGRNIRRKEGSGCSAANWPCYRRCSRIVNFSEEATRLVNMPLNVSKKMS